MTRFIFAMILATVAPPLSAYAGTTGGIAGHARIVSMDGKRLGVASNRVIYITGPQFTGSTHTDARGFYVFLSLPPGGYNLQVQIHDSEYLGQSSICVDADEHQYLDLTVLRFGGLLEATGPRRQGLHNSGGPQPYSLSPCSGPQRLDDLLRVPGTLQ